LEYACAFERACGRPGRCQQREVEHAAGIGNQPRTATAAGVGKIGAAAAVVGDGGVAGRAGVSEERGAKRVVRDGGDAGRAVVFEQRAAEGTIGDGNAAALDIDAGTEESEVRDVAETVGRCAGIESQASDGRGTRDRQAGRVRGTEESDAVR